MFAYKIIYSIIMRSVIMYAILRPISAFIKRFHQVYTKYSQKERLCFLCSPTQQDIHR
jgi:hypothetical protein